MPKVYHACRAYRRCPASYSDILLKQNEILAYASTIYLTFKYDMRLSPRKRKRESDPLSRVCFHAYFTLQLFTFDHSPKYVMPLNS